MAGPRHSIGKRTTIYDLAALAGASPTAVSAVLNGTWRKRRISVALADRIIKLAREQNFSINMQASALRREGSHLIGMLVPKYDNRYFGLIAEQFEMRARDAGLFPMITCTRRNPELELQAAQAMISHQVDCLISTGATDPDRISALCKASGVRSFNLDLPGRLAPSVISDNYEGALTLTRRILADTAAERLPGEPLIFIGGRISDHNTSERLRGFRDAHAEAGITVSDDLVHAQGYAQDKAAAALTQYLAQNSHVPKGIFVTSTITLEGVMRVMHEHPAYQNSPPFIGCFDWDPVLELLPTRIVMVRQDVETMLKTLFDLIGSPAPAAEITMIPTIAHFEKTAAAS